MSEVKEEPAATNSTSKEPTDFSLDNLQLQFEQCLQEDNLLSLEKYIFGMFDIENLYLIFCNSTLVKKNLFFKEILAWP